MDTSFGGFPFYLRVIDPCGLLRKLLISPRLYGPRIHKALFDCGVGAILSYLEEAVNPLPSSVQRMSQRGRSGSNRSGLFYLG